MKRILIAVLIVALLICLVAWHDGPDDGDYDYSGIRTQHPIYAFNLEDYALFLERCSPMPKWFITYDEISMLGEFVSFAFEPNLAEMRYNNLERPLEKKGEHDAICASYNLKDATGYEYTFAYYHWYLDEAPKAAYDDVVVRESVVGSKSVTWMYKGTEFVIFWLDEYPKDATDTFVSRLLNPATADTAAAEISLAAKGY